MSDTTISDPISDPGGTARPGVLCLRVAGDGDSVGAGDAETVRDARHQVADALSSLPADARDTAELLSGEVVTNAVLHGGGAFLLEVYSSANAVRVEVSDASAVQPRLLQPSEDREHGRGMAIVDAMSTRWGVKFLAASKVVWFELDLAPPRTRRVRRRASA